MTTPLIKNLKKKEERLHSAGESLKLDFVGLDKIIDEIIQSIRIWFLMPELITRPVIINLWGLTGVGKTDLIRRLMKYLDFSDNFIELELNNNPNGYGTISGVLDENSFVAGKQSVILFDEIQKFRTISANGDEVLSTSYQDFWELLSDGRLSRRVRGDVESAIYDLIYYQKMNTPNVKENPDSQFVDNWMLKRVYKLIGKTMQMGEDQKVPYQSLIDELKGHITSKKVYEQLDFSQTLLFICGNLDEAFTMAGMTSESDIDADIFRAMTDKISLVDIKSSLAKRFRPEQVARFGNIHVIYPSLSRNDFETLIDQKIRKIETNVESKFNIKLNVDNTINKLIYKNGVFPVQGVRPVLSSISDILETNLSYFLFETIINKSTKLEIKYNPIQKILVGKSAKYETKIPYTGRLDKIRESNEVDVLTSVSVHESGHALVYSLEFGLSPIQLKSKVASLAIEGFTFPHQIQLTKKSIISKIRVLLAGGLSEKLIFGRELQSIGWQQDLSQITSLASEFIRKYGFGKTISLITTERDSSSVTNTDIQITNDLIEDFIQSQKLFTEKLLKKNIIVLKDLANHLRMKGDLSSQECQTILKKHKIVVESKSEKFMLVPNYAEIFNRQLTQIK
jgi:Peptidase family M41/C-terminal, D2-small domain, of ClpB protein